MTEYQVSGTHGKYNVSWFDFYYVLEVHSASVLSIALTGVPIDYK